MSRIVASSNNAPDAQLLRVGVVMPLAEVKGGAEMALRHLIQQGKSLDVEWCFAFLKDGSLAEEARSYGYEVKVFPGHPLRYLHLTTLQIIRLSRWFKNMNCDVAFAWMSLTHIVVWPAAKLAGIPSGWFLHGIAMPPGRIDRINSALHAAGILSCSQYVADIQQSLGGSTPLHVVHPGVELERFDPASLLSPAEMRTRLQLPPDGPLIGMVARLQRWKGVHTLIQAMAAVREQLPNAHCVVVGGRHDLEAEYEQELHQQIQDMHLEDCVSLTGFQSNTHEWMQAMDIVVHASDREPFGIVILEAMAMAKPVIAGSEGGPREIITERVNGLLSPYNDTASLTKNILCILQDQDAARSMGLAARERALEFSTRKYAESVANALHKIADSCRDKK